MAKNDLYDFGALKKRIEAKGYVVNKPQAYVPIRLERVNLNDLSASNIVVKNDFLYHVDPLTGVERQAFLYKKYFDVAQYGKPKFHLCICRTIQEYGQDEYRLANTNTVVVNDLSSNNSEVEISNLDLCKNCIRLLRMNGHNISDVPLTSDEMERVMREAAEKSGLVNGEIAVDMNGYVKDWEKISMAYRTKHNFVCENCGIELSGMNKMFLHVHHINGIKTDNRESNLRCLCIKCHSEVDDTHRKNFSEGYSKFDLDWFNKKFKGGNKKSNN